MLAYVKDGMLNSRWDHTAAATGRLTSACPNLQAVPRLPVSLHPLADCGIILPANHPAFCSVIPTRLRATSWRRSIVVRTLVSAGELSLSCARVLAGWVTTLWLSRPLLVSQHGQLCQPSLNGR